MPFLDTNSHLTTKPYNFDIKFQSNSESYDQHGFFGTKFRGGQNFLLTVGSFFNKRDYSEAKKHWGYHFGFRKKITRYIVVPSSKLYPVFR